MSKANVAVKMPETRGFETEDNKTAASPSNDTTLEVAKTDGAARNAKDVGSEAEEIGRAEEEGMCHPNGPEASNDLN